ncbi:uncharacterized protein [Penaeus vannamei]|uniref:uncharacterized protein n=1 Tax=Penaeus vannamei TaxID=6689 RepID=UPI00387F60C9
MRTDAFTLLLLLGLALLRPTEGKGLAGAVREAAGRTILSQDEADSLHVVIAQFFTGGSLLTAIFIVFMSMFKPFYTLFTSIPKPGVVRQRSAFVGNALSGIDLMDIAFDMMDLEDVECRERAVCEFQKTASGIPILGGMVESASSLISGFEKYREAQASGAALGDCNALYKCFHSSKGSSARKRRDVFPPWMKLS